MRLGESVADGECRTSTNLNQALRRATAGQLPPISRTTSLSIYLPPVYPQLCRVDPLAEDISVEAEGVHGREVAGVSSGKGREVAGGSSGRGREVVAALEEDSFMVARGRDRGSSLTNSSWQQ